MSLITKKYLIFSVLFNLFFSLHSQNNPDDYWLNNGFSDGETVYVNSGFFYDDGGYDLYNAGQDWSVRFCSENGNPITLDFNGFRTHYEGTTEGDYNNWDYMSINYPGTSLVAYDTDTPQFSFTAPGGCISIGFHSKPEGVSQPDSGWVAEISTNPPPPNNDQCSATELVVGNVCSPSFYSNKGAWDTRGLGRPSCHEKFFGGDVWFSAIVPDSGQLKIETIPGSLTYGIMVLYRGSCESLTEHECVKIPGTMPSRTFTGLTPGERVYIRIFGDQAQSGTFGICATDPTAEISGFTGPGGVGDAISNKLWLKADTGVADPNMVPVTDGVNAALWMDQSGNDNHLKQYNTSLQPLYNITGMNNRPALTFNSVYMTDTLGIFAAPVNIFTVQSFAISKDHSVLAMGNATESNTLSIGREDITNNYYTYSNGKHYGQELPATPHLLYARYLVDTPFHTYQLNDNQQTVNFTEGQVATNGALYLGADKDLTTFMDGNISEVVFYSKVLNEAQEIIVSNYLGAKYNIAISNDYFDHQDTHSFDLAGIGRTNAANIHTKAQSAGVLSIGGASELGDNEFVLFAHDGTDIMNWTLNEGPASDTEVMRLQREWKLDITGNGPGTVSVGIDTSSLPALPDGYNAYNILVDSDGDFTSGARFYGFIPAGAELLANNINLEDGDYITIATVKAKVNFSSQASSGLESLERPVIRVELSYAISDQVSVAYSVTSGTADTEDYSLNDDVLLFEPGERVKEIIPLIFEDTIVEIPNEYFNINLDVNGSTVIAGDTMNHVYTIIDNDMSLFVSATDTVIGGCDNSTTMLTANASGQPPLSYSWFPLTGLSDPSGETTIANPSETTTYKVTVTDSLGNTLEDSLEIIVEPVPPKPAISITGETEFCQGGSVELSAPDGYAYSWNNGESSQTIVADTTGQFSVIVIDDNGCESISSDPVDVTEYELPEKPDVSINGETELCEGESVELIAPDGFSSYEWNTGETTQSVTITQAGDYNVRVTNDNACTSVSSDNITVSLSTLPPKPEISYSGDLDLCQGENIDLSAPEGYNYLWSTGETSRTINVNEEGKYSLVLINGACTSSPADSVEVNVYPLPEKPVITPSGSVDIITGESVTLTSSEADSYQWSTLATTREIEVSEEGEYTVKVFNSHGCESELSDPVVVTVTQFLPAPEITIQGDTAFCEGGNVTLIAEEAYAYTWSNGETTREITVSESGTFSVVIENTGGVESYPSEDVRVEVFSNPAAEANVNDVSCFNGSDGNINLTITKGELPYSVEWDNGSSGTSLDGLSAGDYNATIRDANGCQTDLEATVEQPAELFINGEVTDARCPDASDGEVMLSVSGGTSPYTYNWEDGFSGPVLSELSAGIYNVTVIDANNCTMTRGFSVENRDELCFRIPDIITPNGDGKNDTWEISGLELYPQVVVQIYDRWGKRVFYSEGYDVNFDGTYNGEELPMESYHYVINLNDGSPVIIGNITIVR